MSQAIREKLASEVQEATFRDLRPHAERQGLFILKSEEEHVDFLETQLGLIEKIGEERYMQSQMKSEEG